MCEIYLEIIYYEIKNVLSFVIKHYKCNLYLFYLKNFKDLNVFFLTLCVKKCVIFSFK